MQLNVMKSDKPLAEYASVPTITKGFEGVTLAVDNARCCIVMCPPNFLGELDRICKYPTAMAQAQEGGWRPPQGSDPEAEEEPPSWDGYVKMLRQPTTKACWMPAGLTRFAMHACERMGLPCTLIDTRVKPEFGFPEPVTWGFKFRPYQQRAIDAALAKGRGVIDIPPRGGKTAIGLEIQRCIALPTLWIAPTDRIVQQTVERATALFGKNYAHHQQGVGGWKDACYRNLVICTAATARSLPQEFWDSRQVWFIDEFHHAAARTYHQMEKMAAHIYYRFGLTGTFFRSADDEMALHAVLANTIAKIESKDLLDQGVLVPTRVVFVPVEAAPLRVGKDFQAVLRHGIAQHQERNQLITYSVQQLVKAGRRVLVLVNTKAQGRELVSMIRAVIPGAPSGCQFQSAEFVSTDTPRPIITQTLKSFTAREEVQVLIGTSLVGEGVDLPSADALVYAAGGKAEVSLTQNAYRVCTADHGKTNSIIVDFADRHHKHLIAHSAERLAVYAGDPVFKLDVVSNPREIAKWFEHRMIPVATPEAA